MGAWADMPDGKGGMAPSDGMLFRGKENARRIPVKPLTLEPRVTIVKDISL